MKIIVLRNVTPCSDRDFEKLLRKVLPILAENKLQDISDRPHGISSNKKVTRMTFTAFCVNWKPINMLTRTSTVLSLEPTR